LNAQTIKCFSPGPEKHSGEDALAFLLTNNLSKAQYNSIKTACASKNCDIFPNYNVIVEEKKQCRPAGIIYRELEVLVPMQELCDHTTRKIFAEVR